MLFQVSDNGVKSIPIQNLPPEAWKNVTGGTDGASGDLLTLYESIPWLYRGVEACANALSNMPLAIHEGDEDGRELEQSEWPVDVNLRQLLNMAARDYKLFGRSYTFVNLNVIGTITTNSDEPDLKRYLPTSIEPKYSESNGLEKYIRTLKSGQAIDIPKEQLAAWFKPPVRTEVGFGKSDAMVALHAAGVILNSDLYIEYYFKNGAVNPTLVSMEGQLQPQEAERVENWIQRQLKGIKNAFKLRFFEGGKLYTATLGYALKDLMAVELTVSKREDIATALGVPQTMLFSSAANYATALQDDLHFYDKTIKPDAAALEEVWNEIIFHPLGYHLKFHPERMEIYQRLEAEKATSVRTLSDGGIWTKREARQATNMPALPAEDDPQYDDFVKQEKPEPSPVANTPPNQQQPADDTETDNEFDQEMKRWQAVALTRFKENRLVKALDFKSDVLPMTLMSAIKGALETVKHTDEIKAVFADAIEWRMYP